MNDFVKNNIKSITIGIISSILFLYLFQPILDFIGRVFLDFLSYTGSKYSNDFYSKIAHLELFDFSFYWIAIIFTIVGYLFGETSIKGFISLFQKKGSLTEKKDNNTNTKKQQHAPFYFLNLIACIFIIIFLSTKVYQLKLITSFKQHMRIVAPYISEQVEEELYSQWSLMDKAEDYEAVNQRLNSIASQNKITLPRNKIYSLSTF